MHPQRILFFGLTALGLLASGGAITSCTGGRKATGHSAEAELPPLPQASPAGPCGSSGPRGRAPPGTTFCERPSPDCRVYCEQGHAASCTELAYEHLYGAPNPPGCPGLARPGAVLSLPDRECALRLFDRACRWGDTAACLEYTRSADDRLAPPFDTLEPRNPSLHILLFRLQSYESPGSVPQAPLFHGFRILSQSQLIDPWERAELVDILGRRTSFAPTSQACGFGEFGVHFEAPGRPALDVLVSFSCNRVMMPGLPWAHRCDGMTENTIRRLSRMVRHAFPS